MKRLIIDMDDVMANATGQFIDYYEKEFGVRVTRDSLNHKEEGLGFPGNHEAVNSFPFRPGFFIGMQPNDNSQEVVRELNKKYELFVVSSAVQFPQSLGEKLDWLNLHFPFLTWQQLVFCGSKAVVYGDYMIDDLPHNLEKFNGEKFMFTAPHNMQFNHFQRLNNWREVGDKFL